MKKLCSSLLLLFVFMAFHSNAQDVFLKAMGPSGSAYPGLIKGDATERGHENEIKVLSYSTGVAGCPVGAPTNGAKACKVSVSSLSFMTQFSEGVNPLRHFALTGTILPTADFVFEKSSGGGAPNAYYKIHMEDVTVSSIQESGSSEMPMFAVEFSAARIAFGVYKQNSSGNFVLASSVGYNVATNSSWSYSF